MPSNKELQAALDAANAKNEKLSKANDLLGKRVTNKKKKVLGNAIKGSFVYKGTDVNGKPIEQAYGFQDGAIATRLPLDGNMQAPTEALIKIANGDKLSDDDQIFLDQSQTRAILLTDGKDNGAAMRNLNWLVELGYSLLVKV